jgi:hypothetical protein
MKPRAQRIGLLLATALIAAGSAQSSWADGRYGGKHHYKAPYGHQYHRHDGHGYRRHDGHGYRRYNSNDDENLIYGLLVGGLFGYVIGNAQQQAYSAPSYPPPETRYQPAPPSSTCLQEREYQMTVIVGGKEAQAYGTACLQPDGSWYRGPAKVVSH